MDVKIDKLIYGGEGLGHAEGATVFVPFVLPAEIVSVEPVERKKKFVRGRVNRLIEASPQRITPHCPYFNDCGGCHYQHIPIDAQLRYKTEILRETLRRIGHIDWSGPIIPHTSPPWGYRNRAQWKVRFPGRNDGQANDQAPQFGYFRAGSMDLVSVDECAVLSPLLESALRRLREFLSAGDFPNSLREIEAFVDADDEKLLLNASFSSFPKNAAQMAEHLRGAVPGIESILLQDLNQNRMELFGPGYLRTRVGEFSYRVGHMSFFQVNRHLVNELAAHVVDLETNGELALDLFSGVGLFTLPLAKKFDKVVAVESNPAAIRDLEFSLATNQLKAETRNVEVDGFLRKFRESPQYVVIDPPRAGLSAETSVRLAKLRPDRITYVSCEPSTLARDLAAFSESGYAVRELHLFDLFPQTFHIETVVKLGLNP